MKSKQEIEAKIRITDEEKDKIERKIPKTDSFLQKNSFYKINNKIVRVRFEKDDKIVCVKGERKPGKYNSREEIEFNFNGKELFNVLGLDPLFYYEKHRKQVNYKNCVLCIDKVDGKYYLEIEGENEDISNILKELGLDKKEIETKSYFEILGGKS